MNIFLQLSNLVLIVVGQYSSQQKDVGCIEETIAGCQKLCVLGVEDCSSLIPKCEYGYFLFTLGASESKRPECVQCPYYQVNINSDLVNYCMDCFEDPYGWEFSRKCTYDYEVGNGKLGQGTYQKIERDYPELFFVGNSISQGIWTGMIGRERQMKYAVYICTGCKDFCKIPDESTCYTLGHDYQKVDFDKIAVECVEGYYMKINTCESCSIKYCSKCSSIVGSGQTDKCELCQDGYRLSEQTKSCIQCTNYCSVCYTVINGSTEYQKCRACNAGYIPSLDLNTCEGCEANCLRCEYVSIANDDIQYPTRSFLEIGTEFKDNYVKICRQCQQSNDILYYDGQLCVPSQISNCDIGYYQISLKATPTKKRNTIDLDFQPYNRETDSDPVSMCLYCKTNFVLSEEGTACSAVIDAKKILNCISHQLIGTNYKCIKCSSGYSLDTQQGMCFLGCSDQIDNCSYCISYDSPSDDIVTYYDATGTQKTGDTQKVYSCLVCDEGFYADFFTNACLPCQSYCSSCSQYNQDYNFTSFILQRIVMDAFKKSKYLTTSLEEPFCSSCTTGFSKYENKCVGCTKNCVISNPSQVANNPLTSLLNACEYQSDGAYCGQCFNYQRDRSLNSELSECQTCPYLCNACRDRTEDELNRVNYYFSPSNSILQKYSRLCYVYHQHVALNKQVTYDTYLNMPVQCDYVSGKSKKCVQNAQIDIKLYCSNSEYTTAYAQASSADKPYIFSLSYFYSMSASSIYPTNITLHGIETLTLYKQLNEKVITSLILNIYLISQSKQCNFDSSTNFIFELQKNVFSIRYFYVNIIGETDSTKSPLTIMLDGLISIPWSDYLTIKGIEIKASTPNSTYPYTGLNISQNVKTKLSLENFKLTRDKKYVNLVFFAENIDMINWKKVTFTGLSSTDLFSLTYPLQNIDTVNYIFDDVKFDSCDFEDTVLFSPTSNSKVRSIIQSIGTLGMTFHKCKLTNTVIFGEPEGSPVNSGLIDFGKVVFKFTKFTNSWFIYLKSQNKTIINNIDVIRCNFTEGSKLVQSNSFYLRNIYSLNSTFYTESRLFSNSYKVIDELYASLALQYYSFSNVKLINSICLTPICFIKISTPINNYQYFTNVSLQDFYIEQTNSMKLTEKKSNSILSALILMTTVQKIQISNFQSLNNFGITQIAAYKIQSLRLVDGLYDWSQDQYYAFRLNPTNNRIPTSKDCADRKTEFKSYNEHFLYIADFDIGVMIENVIMRRLLSIDTNFIQIQSWDAEQFNTTSDVPIQDDGQFYDETTRELIILKNIKLIGNSLTITESGTAIGSIYIESGQDQDITIEDCEFGQNHLHSLISDQLSPSSPIFVIHAPLSFLEIKNSIFDNNRATRVHNSIIYVITYSIKIINCKFKNTNIRQKEWVYRLEEQQIVNYTSTESEENDIITILEQFFPIYSIGGNMFIKSANTEIENSIFDKAQAIQGAGLIIQTIDAGNITIINTQFIRQYNSLLNQYSSNGGCLYIDSSNSKLSLIIDRVEMQECVTRLDGGCLYINPSTYQSSVDISNSKFISCLGLKTSGIYMPFSTSSPSLPSVSITKSSFSQNNIGNFIRNIPDITNIDTQFLYTKSTILYQSYGHFTLTSSIFKEINFVAILILDEMVEVEINDVTISKNTIFINSIISITLYDVSGVITLTSTKILDHIQFDSTTNTNCKEKNYYVKYVTENVLYEQTCLDVETLDSSFRSEGLPNILYQKSTDTNSMYFADLDTFYNSLTDALKYQVDRPDSNLDVSHSLQDNINLNLIFRIFTTFSDEENLEFLACFLGEILENYYDQNSEITTSLFKLESVTKDQYLTIEQVTIENNKCLRCENGLIQILTIHQETYPVIEIKDFRCLSNSAGYYGCLVLTYDNEINEVEQSIPLTDYSLSNSKRLLTVVEDLLKLKNVIIISQSSFIGNSAKVGGGLSIIGLDALIIHSEFIDNYASLMGGALYYKSTTYKTTSTALNIADNTIEGNIAQLAGGMFISGGSIGNVTSIEIFFQNNDGLLRGDNLEEYPQSLTLSMRTNQFLKTITFQDYDGDVNNDGFIDSSKSTIIDIISLDSYQLFNYKESTTFLLLPSGQAINSYKYYYIDTDEQVPYEWQFKLINLDRYKQPMSNILQTESCTLSARIMDTNNYNTSKEFLSNFTNKQIVYYDQRAGAFDFDSLIVTFDPYLEDNLFLQLRFVCTSIKIPVYQTISPYKIQSYNQNYALYVNVKTLPCQLGEAYSLQQCKACTKADKTYSVNEKQTQCQAIDSSTMDDVSPVGIKLKEGYWRPEFDSEIITYCLNLPENCNGGWKPGNPSCYTGHMGALCESCDIYGVRDEFYSTSAKYKCGPCANTLAVNAIVITALSFVTLFSMILSVKGNYQMLEDFVRIQNKKAMGIIVSSSESNLAILIKLFTNYFQILSAISTFQINLSGGITNATQVLGNPTQSMAYSLDCFLVTMTNVEILYFRLIWAIIMPIIYLSVFLFGYFLAVLLKKVDFKEGIIYTAFIYMFLYLQPNLVGGFIALASSREIGGLGWVQADVLYQYDTDTHYIWLAGFVAPMLICWAFIFPCIFMFLVYQMRNHLDKVENRKKLGYFYNEYTNEGYLWEFVKIFEKELIIIFLTFYEDRVVVKGLIIFLIVFFYGGFTVRFHPYSSKRLNFIDRLSTAICAASLCLGVLIYSSIKEGLIYLEIIMLIIVALINFAFILLMIYYLFEGYLIKFQPQLDKIRDQLRIHHPEIMEKYPWSRKMLFNQAKMNEKVKKLWATLRYQTRKGIKRRRQDPQAPLFVNENIDQPILLPFSNLEKTQQQKTNNYQESPNFQKIFPEQDGLESEQINLNQRNQEL
ncbi:unnamed protein product [Paramecium sonneborni]|uniref:Uncharacterized protein n=1 Tax=Paramecium sonneborni TaxID=65129 RepID=A0A8S1RJB1_9CILI|nr:unnamed protein product [Paramecium sonneborni]